jgi:MSHA biogenesis protein MshI
MAAARLIWRADAEAQLTDCVYQPLLDDHGHAAQLGKLPLGRAPVCSVLEPAGYQLLLVEAPDVPEEELRAAVRWRIKDLIDFHIDDAVIDVFEMPSHSRGAEARMMYTVAARAERVRNQVDLIGGAGFSLEAIDIEELCLRNIADRLEEHGSGIAFVYLADRHSVLILVRQGVMYLTRRIDTGVVTLAEAEGLRGELVAGLALEVQRSLDYFESHYDQKPVPSLYTAGLDLADRNALAAEVSVAVKDLDLRNFLRVDCELDGDLQRRCLPAIGAALRRDEVAL